MTWRVAWRVTWNGTWIGKIHDLNVSDEHRKHRNVHQSGSAVGEGSANKQRADSDLSSPSRKPRLSTIEWLRGTSRRRQRQNRRNIGKKLVQTGSTELTDAPSKAVKTTEQSYIKITC